MIHKILKGVSGGFAYIKPSSQESNDNKFGTFAGVFTPTILTILGAIMYLRLGQVVGNAGLVGALIIILLAHLITISTGLSVSSISTNTRVGAGGAFAIISQSLGLEVGGSVGLPLFLAQGISVALYVLAFAEAWTSIPAFEGHGYGLVCVISFFIIFLIAYRSAQFAARIQFIILGIVFFSLVSIALGAFPIGTNIGFSQQPELWGTFALWDFWTTFAIFFPAVTGIMAGISMSGVLRDPRKSIPKGTMMAIFLAMAIYLILVYWLSRIATPEELMANQTIMVDKAIWGWAVLLGMLGATFSSALGSNVAAPRVMQALASYKLTPFSELFAQETDEGEPRPAMLLTGTIGFIALVAALSIGGAGGALDAIAAVITMFFLIAYASLNLVVLVEQTLGMVSFRPTFKIPRTVPFVGLVGCLFVMFLVNAVFSLVAMILVTALFLVLTRRSLDVAQNDVRSGLFISLAEWATKRARKMPSAPERAWKPVILAPVRSTAELNGSFRFLYSLTKPQGTVHALGIYPPGDQSRLDRLLTVMHAFEDDGITAKTAFLEEDDFVRGVRASTQVLRQIFFRPNTLFLNLNDNDLVELQELVDKTAAYQMAIVLLARHPVMNMGREKYINIWVTNQGNNWEIDIQQTNLDMAILTAVQLSKNWDGHITLCTAVKEDGQLTNAYNYLTEIIKLARLSQKTKIVILEGPFYEVLSIAPEADLSIFGLPEDANLSITKRIYDKVDASCIFVRDSGEESAFT